MTASPDVEARTAALFNHFPDRFLFGTDVVAPKDQDAQLRVFHLWDGVFAPSSATIADVIVRARALPTPDPKLAAKSDADAWIAESLRAAHVKAYAPPVGADGGPFTLSDAYAKDARAVANARIALAGVRLANLLNTELE